jgi:hypothetical protein
MPETTLLAAHSQVIWHLFPLAAVISLVYSATRYELPPFILRRAARLFVTITLFMAIVLGVLYTVSFGQ